MTFLKMMKEQAARTRTMNGAAAYESSGDACLDLFAVGGGMRYRKRAELFRLFDRAYIENPDLAMKLLFYIRDIRGGMGEREIFRTLLRHVAFTWPASAEKNVKYISEYGRWDDLLALMKTPVQDEAVQVIRKQLEKDLAAVRSIEAGAESDPDRAAVSLLAKWMPSDNASGASTRRRAKYLAEALGLSEREYRKTLVQIRRHLALPECRLTENHTEKIRYDAVPSRAMLKYRCAFERKDAERFGKYLEEVEGGARHMHAATLDPPDILRPFFGHSAAAMTASRSGRAVAGQRTLEALWRSQRGDVGSKNALCVVDTSGSMYWKSGKGPLPALYSQALGLFFAERCEGAFHNHIVTFESRPHLLELHGETLADKLRYLQSAPWGGSTDLTAVFDLVLQTALKMRAAQEEMPAVLYILSDMEFNTAFRSPDSTVFEDARKRYAAHGYELPAVVFHNVNAWQTQTPVRAHTKGAALTSSGSVSAMSAKFTKNTTPLSHMLEVLLSERYRCISAA